MKKQLGVLVIVLLGLLALAPFSYAQEPKVIDDVAPFWGKWFTTFLFTGTQADINCRSTWECVKDSNGLYRYDCYADASSANGCLCYRTTDPSKCKLTLGTTTTSPPSGTSGASCTDALGKTIASGAWACTGLAKATCNNGVISYQLNAPECASTVTQVSCSDSDGLNYLTKGTVIWTGSASNKITYEDKCYSSYVLTEWGCSGKDPVGNSVSCPNGCSSGACSGTAPVTTKLCTKDEYQCSGTKVQKCVSGSLESTYWSDWMDCGTNQCQILSGAPVCPSTGPTPPVIGPTNDTCVKEGEFKGFGGVCCEGLSTGGYKIGTCTKLAENETVQPPVLPPNTNDTLVSGKSVSLTFKEWQDSTIAQRFKTICKTNDQCEKYEDIEGTGKEYVVKCNANSRVQSQLQDDVDVICGDSAVQTFFKQNKVQTLVVGGAVGLAGGCAAGVTYGAGLGLGFSLVTGGVSIPVGATLGCLIGAIGGTALTSVATNIVSNAVFINCENKKVPADAGACIAVPKGGTGTFGWLTEEHDIFGLSIPTWGIALGIIILLMLLPTLLGGGK